MKQLKITTTASAIVTLDGLDIDNVIKQAADLAHEVLEELSIYRQRNDLDPMTFSCENSCCAFLDLIDDRVMKANEASEKLYFGEGDKVILDIYSNRDSNDQVEYTRTDAFIEKAAKWLEDNAIEYWGTEAVDNGMMIDDFKKAMKL